MAWGCFEIPGRPPQLKMEEFAFCLKDCGEP